MSNSITAIQNFALAAIVLAAAFVAFAMAPTQAGAHTLEVQPPGNETIDHGAVSQSYAQAHCHARSPEVLGDRGAATFSPAEALPCPEVENPGGQVHPHAGD